MSSLQFQITNKCQKVQMTNSQSWILDICSLLLRSLERCSIQSAEYS